MDSGAYPNRQTGCQWIADDIGDPVDGADGGWRPQVDDVGHISCLLQKAGAVHLDLIDFEGCVGQRLDGDETGVLIGCIDVDDRLLVFGAAGHEYVRRTGALPSDVQEELIPSQKVGLERCRGGLDNRVPRVETYPVHTNGWTEVEDDPHATDRHVRFEEGRLAQKSDEVVTIHGTLELILIATSRIRRRDRTTREDAAGDVDLGIKEQGSDPTAAQVEVDGIARCIGGIDQGRELSLDDERILPPAATFPGAQPVSEDEGAGRLGGERSDEAEDEQRDSHRSPALTLRKN